MWLWRDNHDRNLGLLVVSSPVGQIEVEKKQPAVFRYFHKHRAIRTLMENLDE